MLKRNRVKKFIKKFKTKPGEIFILAGFVLVVISSLWKVSLAAPKSPSYTQTARIAIPSLNVNLPVKEGGIVDGRWILSEDSVMLLPESSKPGEGYNTVLYAHNKPHLFANLKNIQAGDQIIIENQEGNKFSYEVYSLEYVNPQEIDKIKSEVPNSLTLFTCNGFFDQQRLVVKAKLNQKES